MLIKTIKTEKLETYVYDSRDAMGRAAGAEAARVINKVIEEKGFANVIFAAAPSQNETLASLLEEQVDFTRINAFHMDEYAGLSIDQPQSFARYLYDHVFSKAPFASVNYIPATLDVDSACAAYTELLTQNPPDVVLMGIGENGHIAFNDPPADFDDERAYKVVTLNDACLRQQVREGWFESPEAAFKQAISMTCRQIMKCECIISVVPHAVTAQAIHDTLTCEINENVPATLLKNHKDVTVYCDENSASLTDAKTLARFA